VVTPVAVREHHVVVTAGHVVTDSEAERGPVEVEGFGKRRCSETMWPRPPLPVTKPEIPIGET